MPLIRDLKQPSCMQSFTAQVVRTPVRATATVAATIALLGLMACAQEGSPDAAHAAAMEQLRVEVAGLKDRQQIYDVYIRYMRGFDRNDVEYMRGAFWPDVQINYGKQSNTFDEFATRHLAQHVATLRSWGHILTNFTVDLAGDSAHVEAYVLRLASRKEDGKSDMIGVRYIDRLEKHDGEWRIAVREAIPYFYTETDIDLHAKLNTDHWPACTMGTLDKRDPSYLRPLKPRSNKEIGPACAE